MDIKKPRNARFYKLHKATSVFCDCSTLTSVSSAIEELLNIADTANITTANITVVSLNPREDDLFILFPVRDNVCCSFFIQHTTIRTYMINK